LKSFKAADLQPQGCFIAFYELASLVSQGICEA